MITVDERVIRIVRGLSEREREKLAAVGGAFVAGNVLVGCNGSVAFGGDNDLSKAARRVRVEKFDEPKTHT